MNTPLYPIQKRMPPVGWATSDEILDRFLAYLGDKNLTLYAAQEEALLELMAGKNLILNTPTGSGKSLVALGMHFKAMAEGKRSFYTCPIKALVSEKFFALCNEFGPDSVGMLTGDASVNRDAPIICCTAEILANMALREGDAADVDYVIMDEFHYYSDRERGVAWQIPLLTLPHVTFLLMSATLGKTEFFEKCLTDLTGLETAVVRSTERPVPLDFEYRETPLHETILHMIARGKSPVYVVNFTQRSCAEEAQNLMSIDFSTKDEKKAINAALEGVRFDSPYGKEFARFLRHGIGLHHAGLLPKYRLLVEKLSQQSLLKIICGTDTLGVGVNIPIRTVLFTKLCKYDGEKTAILSVRDFQQISGRAGRKGFDEQGSVAVQAPEHVIENLRLEQKALLDPAKRKKIVKKKPPEKGYVHWDRGTYERLTTAPPEPLVSRFQVSHGMLLNVVGRPGGCAAMKRLIRTCHEGPTTRRNLGKTAISLFRSLVEAGVLTLAPIAAGGPVLVNAELQAEFSLNQVLALYLLDTMDKLDKESDTHSLDVLTLVESILEDPTIILLKQEDRLKTEKMAEMKANGVEYEERIAELEKIKYPKPNSEFIYATYNDFARAHPWVGQENIRPKSIAREMFESYLSFSEYIREYALQRSEGLLLRYLSDVYKALVQTVPEREKTPEVDEIVVYFGAIVRSVDSSLIDEWERMRDPAYLTRIVKHPEEVLEEAPDITRDERAFTVLVRNALFQVLRALAARDYDGAVLLFEGTARPPAAGELEALMRPFYDDHKRVRVDPQARSPSNTRVFRSDDRATWRVEQIVLDPDEHNDWVLKVDIDLARSREAGRPVLALAHLGA